SKAPSETAPAKRGRGAAYSSRMALSGPTMEQASLPTTLFLAMLLWAIGEETGGEKTVTTMGSQRSSNRRKGWASWRCQRNGNHPMLLSVESGPGLRSFGRAIGRGSSENLLRPKQMDSFV